MNEINVTMKSHGMSIDARHVMLLADLMTYKVTSIHIHCLFIHSVEHFGLYLLGPPLLQTLHVYLFWTGVGRGGELQMEHLSIWKAFTLSDNSVKCCPTIPWNVGLLRSLIRVGFSVYGISRSRREFPIPSEAVWPSYQRVGLALWRSRVRVALSLLAGFVLGYLEFKLSATLVNSQRDASCKVIILILLCHIWIICF